MFPENDSGLMSAPESEVLHELARLRCENERLRGELADAKSRPAQRIEVSPDLAERAKGLIGDALPVVVASWLPPRTWQLVA